jgi:ribosomal protein S19E (S16A)
MEDEYLAGMGIGTIRVLNAEKLAYGDLDIELEVLKRLEANGLVKIIQEHRESYSGMRVLKLVSYRRLQ